MFWRNHSRFPTLRQERNVKRGWKRRVVCWEHRPLIGESWNSPLRRRTALMGRVGRSSEFLDGFVSKRRVRRFSHESWYCGMIACKFPDWIMTLNSTYFIPVLWTKIQDVPTFTPLKKTTQKWSSLDGSYGNPCLTTMDIFPGSCFGDLGGLDERWFLVVMIVGIVMSVKIRRNKIRPQALPDEKKLLSHE